MTLVANRPGGSQTIRVPQVPTTPDHPPEVILYTSVEASTWKGLHERSSIAVSTLMSAAVTGLEGSRHIGDVDAMMG